MEEKFKKFHCEEILLILFICATSLAQYSDEDLIDFSEDIEGRVEDLFDPEFLKSLNEFIKIDQFIIREFGELRIELVNMYSSEWHKKLRERTINGRLARLAKNILEKMNIEYIEPKFYKENYLNMP